MSEAGRASSPIPYGRIGLEGQRIMLIGGAGFIGHHLALACRAKGAQVLVVDSMQINNIVKIVSDRRLDPLRRRLYTRIPQIDCDFTDLGRGFRYKNQYLAAFLGARSWRTRWVKRIWPPFGSISTAA